MSGVIKLDIIRNERSRGTMKVDEISKKLLESGLKWYGHNVEKRKRILCGQESDGDGDAMEEKERKTKAEVVG